MGSKHNVSKASQNLFDHDDLAANDDIPFEAWEPELVPSSKMSRKMLARRLAEEWWEDRRMEDDIWHEDSWHSQYKFSRKYRRGKSWRSKSSSS